MGRIRARVWALCAVLTAALCATAFAEDTLYAVNGGKLHFDTASGAVMSCEKTAVKIVLPSEIKGFPVRAIAEGAFSGCAQLTSAKFYGLESVGDGAFSGCAKLSNVELPEGATQIGAKAFSDCAALKTFRVPEGVLTVGAEAFSGCAALTQVELPASVLSIGARAFEGCGKLYSIEADGAAYRSAEGVLLGADGARLVRYPPGRANPSYDIPDGVLYVGAEAFRGASKLKKVRLPDGAATIEDGAFSGCAALAEVEIPDSVVSIGGGAFDDCPALETVYFGGTQKQWDAIRGSGKDALLSEGVTIVCAETQDFVVLSAPTLDGRTLRAADLRGLEAIDIPLTVSAPEPTEITLIAAFYAADGRFLGMGFTTATVNADTVSIAAPITGDVTGAARVKTMVCGGLRPAASAFDYKIAL